MDEYPSWSPPDVERRTAFVLNTPHVLGAVGEVVVVAERVEITDARVWLHARAMSNAFTERLTTESRAAGRAWRDLVATDGWDAAGDPPEEPGLVMTEVDVRLGDGADGHDGHPEHCGHGHDRAVSVGGSGTEWVATWSWARPEGDELTFVATSPDGEVTSLRVDPRLLG